MHSPPSGEEEEADVDLDLGQVGGLGGRGSAESGAVGEQGQQIDFDLPEDDDDLDLEDFDEEDFDEDEDLLMLDVDVDVAEAEAEQPPQRPPRWQGSTLFNGGSGTGRDLTPLFTTFTHHDSAPSPSSSSGASSSTSSSSSSSGELIHTPPSSSTSLSPILPESPHRAPRALPSLSIALSSAEVNLKLQETLSYAVGGGRGLDAREDGGSVGGAPSPSSRPGLKRSVSLPTGVGEMHLGSGVEAGALEGREEKRGAPATAVACEG